MKENSLSPKIMSLVLLVISLGGTILLAEVVLRVYHSKSPLVNDWPKHGYSYYGTEYLVKDKYTNHKNRNNLKVNLHQDHMGDVPLEFNSLGIFGDEIGKKEKKHRVMLLGDSFLGSHNNHRKDLIGKHLKDSTRDSDIEIIQHGTSSWSPVTEFAWYHHYGQTLDIDRLYLFLYQNDYFSFCVDPESDESYRRGYKFDREGVPLVFRDFKPSFLWDISYIYRYVNLVWVMKLRDQWNTLWDFARFQIPLEKKMSYFKTKFKGGIKLNPKCSDDVNDTLFNISDRFRSHVIDDQSFPWDNPRYKQMVEFRLPENEWGEMTKRSVQAVVRSMVDFNKRLIKDNVEMVVVYIPSSYEYGKSEYVFDNEFLKSYDFRPTGSEGIENYLKKTLGDQQIRFVSLKEPFLEYKKKECPECKQYLHIEKNGHWNAKGHYVAANTIYEDLKNYPLAFQN